MEANTSLPQCWQDVADATAAGITQMVLYGPPGTGKTFTGLNFGINDAGAYRVICNEDMTSADVTGHYMPTDNGFQWNYGAVLKAWQGNGVVGGRVVADEIDRASGDVLSLLLAMFDSPESASWTHPKTGEVFKPLNGFSVFMTTNLERMEDLPTALADRFPVKIRINQPHPDALTFLSPDLRVAAAKSADYSRGERKSLRSWKAFDKMRETLPIETAARLTLGDDWQSIVDTLKVEAI
jgi:MoxR-like ATPase